MNNWDLIRTTAKRSNREQNAIMDAHAKLLVAQSDTKKLERLEDDPGRLVSRAARTMSYLINPYEKILGTLDYQDVRILDVLAEKSRAVCCILKDGQPHGTGFLVGKNVIITNNHVIRNADEAYEMEVKFDYELGRDDQFKKFARFKLDPGIFFYTSPYEKTSDNKYSGLDFTLVGIEETGRNGEALSNYHPIYLDGNVGKIKKGENCIVIHHPNGNPKKISLRNSAFFHDDEDFIFYESDTMFGSSGGMVVGLVTGDIIALHHAGHPKTDDQGNILKKDGTIADRDTTDEEVEWIANKGIRISRILEALRNAELVPQMAPVRESLLRHSEAIKSELKVVLNELSTMTGDLPKRIITNGSEDIHTGLNLTDLAINRRENNNNPEIQGPKVSLAGNIFPTRFIIGAKYDDKTINTIKAFLRLQYGVNVPVLLVMPDAAVEGGIELFIIELPVHENPEEVARQLTRVPGILIAETDTPLSLNSGDITSSNPGIELRESAIFGDGYSEHREDLFLDKYKASSRYVMGKDQYEYRKWNWFAAGFDKVASQNYPGLEEIRIVQFDTGWTNHAKVTGRFNIEVDYNFIDRSDNAEDIRTNGFLKQPGHGTRTGSVLIGHEVTALPENGNSGLLSHSNVKLIPYRIAESVILIKRQQQLADALNMAIYNNYDIITMSMGLPPTISTAVMAKKAYDAGIIWCCASGNEVQAIVAPAVFPGTIAVAASNPNDEAWEKSSRGTRIDITAPGEDVYVPIFTKPGEDGKEGQSMTYGAGTSFAAPHVAAAAAYWLAKYKNELAKDEYRGWRKVEAFRKALHASARKDLHKLPAKGFGPGILDVEELLATKPSKITEDDNAYNGINEFTSFQLIQAYAEAVKTYWNIFHGWISGSGNESYEAMQSGPTQMTPYSMELMTQLFGQPATELESTGSLHKSEAQTRLKVLMNHIQSSSIQ